MKYKSLSKLGIYDNKKIKNKLLSFFNKVMICTIILLSALIIIKKNPTIKEYISKEIFNNNISFAYIKELYNKYFGDVLPDNSSNVTSVFSEKITYKNKEKYLDGYILEVDSNYLVPVVETGIVVYIGEKKDYGNVITGKRIKRMRRNNS